MRKFFALIAALALILAGCAADKPPAPELLTPVGALVDSVAVEYGLMEEITAYQGAFAVESREMYFTHDCVIAEICAPLGARVSTGQCVAKMDVSSVNNRIHALEVEKANIAAETAYETRLFEIDMELYSIDIQRQTDETAIYDIETETRLLELEFQNAQSRRDERAAQIDIEIAELGAQLEGTELISPCDGRLTLICAGAGSGVGAYDTVCVVTDDSALIAQSPYIPSAALDKAVEIYALCGDKRYALAPRPFREDEYARTVLRGGQYYSEYDILGDTSAIRAGEGAAICVVSVRLENALNIPANALFGDPGDYYVYIMEGDDRSRRDVSVGLITSTAVEITSGVLEGELVYVGN